MKTTYKDFPSPFDDNERFERLVKGVEEIKDGIFEIKKNLKKPKEIHKSGKPDLAEFIHSGCITILTSPYWFTTYAVGLAAVLTTFALGPIDFGRTVYNQIIGDTPVLKRKLVDYVRLGVIRDVNERNIGISPEAELEGLLVPIVTEQRLSEILNAPLDENGEVDYMQTSTSTLWDVAEDYSRNWYHQFVWTSLGN